MRTALLIAELVTAALSLSGCGSGPKSARGSDDTASAARAAYRAEMDRLATAEQVDTVGLKVAKVQESIDGIGIKLDLAQATIDALSTPEEAVPQTPADRVSKTFGEIGDALQVENPAPEVPATPPPASVATPSPPARTVHVNGQSLAFEGFVKQNFKGKWTHPGTIDGHLTADHGVAAEDLKGMTVEEKERLHSALHEAKVPTVTKSRTVLRGPAPAAVQNCPNGQCPLQQPNYRVGPFGRVRYGMRRR